MLNQASVVGRVVETFKRDNGFYVKLEVTRNFKEVNGKFLKDYIVARIFKSLINDVSNKFKIGMVLSIAGMISCVNNDFYIDAYDVDYLGRA